MPSQSQSRRWLPSCQTPRYSSRPSRASSDTVCRVCMRALTVRAAQIRAVCASAVVLSAFRYEQACSAGRRTPTKGPTTATSCLENSTSQCRTWCGALCRCPVESRPIRQDSPLTRIDSARAPHVQSMTDIDGSRVVEGSLRDILKLTQVFLRYVLVGQAQSATEDRTAETSVAASEPEHLPPSYPQEEELQRQHSHHSSRAHQQQQQQRPPLEDPERAALVSEMAQRAASLRTAVTAVADLLDRLEDEKRTERRRRSGRGASAAAAPLPPTHGADPLMAAGGDSSSHRHQEEAAAERFIAEGRSRAASASAAAFVRIPTHPESVTGASAGGFADAAAASTGPSSRRPGPTAFARGGGRGHPLVPVPRLNIPQSGFARPSSAPAHRPPPSPLPPRTSVGHQRPLTALTRSIDKLNAEDATCAPAPAPPFSLPAIGLIFSGHERIFRSLIFRSIIFQSSSFPGTRARAAPPLRAPRRSASRTSRRRAWPPCAKCTRGRPPQPPEQRLWRRRQRGLRGRSSGRSSGRSGRGRGATRC